MWPYWILFFVPAALAVLRPRPILRPLPANPLRWSLEWIAILALLTLMIGYRFEVGGDWGSYIRYLDAATGETFAAMLRSSDPGYMVINWLSVRAGWGIYGVNLFCGAVFSIGLVHFCRNTPRPWLAFAVSVPYLVIVVGMGYSRQGVALGFVMLGLVALQKRSTVSFLVFVLLGATFHKSAVIMLPIAAVANAQNRYWVGLWVCVITLGAYQLLLQDSVDTLVSNYVDAEYQSQGALVRLMMNALPAALLLWRPKSFRFTEAEAPLWRWLSIISLVLLAVVFVSPSSTAVDRVALYMLPIQAVAFARLPEVLGRRTSSNQGWVFAVVLLYALVNFIWLNFAAHSNYWLPYRFYPLESF